MLNFLLAHDNQDTELGEYFTLCKNDLLSLLIEQQITPITEITSNRCNQVYLEQIIAQTQKPFVFVAYSHGIENALVCQGELYVKANENSHLFENSIFYTNACLSGKILGNDLIEKGCPCFVGYEKSIDVLLQNPQISSKCDNYALLLFIGSDITMFEAYKAMKNYYTSESQKLDFVKSAILIDARDALVFLGDKNLRFKDLVKQ